MKKLFYTSLTLIIAAMTLTACSDVPEPYADPNSDTYIDNGDNGSEPAGAGTAADPYNVAAANEIIYEGSYTDDNVYVIGIISQINEISLNYGNATYFISDDLLTGEELEIYRGYALGGDKFTDENEIAVGDSVIVLGQLTLYGSTPEMKQGSLIYSLNGKTNNGDNSDSDSGVYLYETFSSDFGDFQVSTVNGQPWIIDYNTAKASAYGTGEGGDSYLISPETDMSASKGASLSFEYVLRYVKDGSVNQTLITDSYTGSPATTQWTDITGTLTEGANWTTFYTYTTEIPNNFLGKSTVRVALHYSATSADASATWEVKNLTLKEN